MKSFFIATGLFILGLVIVAGSVSPTANSGLNVVVGFFYVFIGYVLWLIFAGLRKAVARWRSNPQKDHPGHRGGLVCKDQIPGFEQKNDP
ncbi:hypothetical protein N9741_02925 [Octadecabacter sp.]|nr:hypothetical protein [Octadecabacter sp.]